MHHAQCINVRRTNNCWWWQTH